MFVVFAAAACSKTEVKTAHPLAIPTAAAASTTSATTTSATTTSPTTTSPTTTSPPATEAPIIDPSNTDPAGTAPRVTVPAPAAPVTLAKSWVMITQFSGSGGKESNTFTMTGAPARVTYKATAQFSLNIDTGDPADDTAVGSCPAAGCTGQGAVQVAAGGWYLHVIAAAPTTAFSVTLDEYR